MKKFLIGLGTGFMTSALIMAVVYISQLSFPKTSYTETTAVYEEITEATYEETTEIQTEPPVQTETEPVTEQEVYDDVYDDVETGSPVTFVVTSRMKAVDICDMLSKNGVISDYDSFYNYIKAKKATQRLRNGEYTLNKNSSNEVVYKALTGG